MTGDEEGRYSGKSGEFESLPDTGAGAGPQKSVEGWILMAMGVHEEAQEEDLYDFFSQYGEIKNLQLPLDRRSGFIKGYALVEFEDKKQAQEAIEKSNGADLLGSVLTVDWAFSRGPFRRRTSTRRRFGLSPVFFWKRTLHLFPLPLCRTDAQ